MLFRAFQKLPFFLPSPDTSLPCSTSVSVCPTHRRWFQQTLIPVTHQFPCVVFFNFIPFLHFSINPFYTSVSLFVFEDALTCTHARTKLSFFHFAAFLSKLRARRGKNLHPHPCSVQLGNFNLLQCLIPPSLSLSHTHSLQGQEVTGHALTTHKGWRRERKAGEKSENIRSSLQIYRQVNMAETPPPSFYVCRLAFLLPAIYMCRISKT